MKEVVVVSVFEVLEVAKENNYGEAECPWVCSDFDECGSFDVYRNEIKEKEDPWSKACIQIMDEEKEDQLVIVKE